MENKENKYHGEAWALLVLTDKGWADEGIYSDEEDAKYYLEEYKEELELPNCSIRIAKVDIKENDNETI